MSSFFDQRLPLAQDDDLPLTTLEDAAHLAADTIRRLRFEQMDNAAAREVFNGLKVFIQAVDAVQRNSPAEIAQREFSATAARRAAESLDVATAKEILSRRNFSALEAKIAEQSP